MRMEDQWESYSITDYHRLKYLGDDVDEILNILLKSIKVGVGLFSVGETIRALYLNEGFFECIGYSETDFAKYFDNILTILHPEDVEGFSQFLAEHIPQKDPIQYTFRGYRGDGSLGLFEVKAVPMENRTNNNPIYLAVFSNISDELEKEIRANELKKINAQLSLQQERYKILEATAQGLLFEYDPYKDTMVFSYNFPNNKKRKEITNYSEYMQKSPLVHSSHIGIFRQALEDACKQVTEGNLEYLSAVSGGGYRWHMTHYKSLADEDGKILSVIGRIEDIHDQKMEKEQLNYKADMDGLTNLYRKEPAFEKMQEYVKEGSDCEFYFVVLDLDDFKQINDRYGHQYGDKILKKTADELIRLFGETSIIGRFGGDEFIILTKNLPYKEVHRLLKALQNNVKFCAGVVTWKNQEDVKDIFDKADQAMYQVKNAKKNGIYFME